MNSTDFIIFYEKYALYRLAEHLKIPINDIRHVSQVNIISPHDLEIGETKYDVKVSSPVLTGKTKTQRIWDFNLRKGNRRRAKQNESDYYVLVGMKNGIPSKVFLVPSSALPGTHVRISIVGISKYHIFEI